MSTQVTIQSSVLELVQGDITQQDDVDTLVNAANSSLLGGGGVDGAIHRAAGPSLLEECRKVGPCPTGEARITGGGNLAVTAIIHAVGPIYNHDAQAAATLLAGAYRSSLTLASQHGLRRVAFPSLSTGAYGYPVDEAAPVALQTVRDYLHNHAEIELVRFVLFDSQTFAGYQHALRSLVDEL
jgi:O-acetyl-ADP-ribose deacetylase (regulator of RNase III)